jgi:hypothetical protein
VYRALYRDETTANIRLIMPAITRFASDCALVFVVLICMAGFLAAMLSRNRPDLGRSYLVAGVSGQVLIAWVAAFCFCFESFTGPLCLHHAPSFELPQFLTTAYGFFPVTLVAVLLPLIGAGRELITNSRPNHTSDGIRQPADGLPKPSR